MRPTVAGEVAMRICRLEPVSGHTACDQPPPESLQELFAKMMSAMVDWVAGLSSQTSQQSATATAARQTGTSGGPAVQRER